jgi:ribosomal protein S27E
MGQSAGKPKFLWNESSPLEVKTYYMGVKCSGCGRETEALVGAEDEFEAAARISGERCHTCGASAWELLELNEYEDHHLFDSAMSTGSLNSETTH